MSAKTGKIIVAPMVRVSTLPFRLLALDYGADLVYSEEIIDFKMLRAQKIHNEVLGTIDFVDQSDGTVFFRTCEREKDKIVFQIGTCDAHRAVAVAKMVEPYVAGIDVNMGCPKTFSLSGGMGAALLTQPEKVRDILTALVHNVSIPVTCKIRLLPTLAQTLELCRMIESCGVAAVAIHGRTRDERPNHTNRADVIRQLAKSLNVPVIAKEHTEGQTTDGHLSISNIVSLTRRVTGANGGSKDINCHDGIHKFQLETETSAVMVARAIMWNCSILRPEGILPIDVVIKSYLTYCIDYDNIFTYTKYTVQNMLRDLQETARGKAFLEMQTLEEICHMWDLEDYFHKRKIERQNLSSSLNRNTKMSLPSSVENLTVTRRKENELEVVEIPLQFIRGNYCSADLPKMLLNTQIFLHKWSPPKYHTCVVEKFFSPGVFLEGILYQSSLREKSRRYAEQCAALVCLHALGLVNATYGLVPTDGARKYSYVGREEGVVSYSTKRNSVEKETPVGNDVLELAESKRRKSSEQAVEL